MPALLNLNAVLGDDEIRLRESPYENCIESSCLLPFAPGSDIYYRPCKRLRVTAPFIITREERKVASVFKKKQLPRSMDSLPDECLFEILRRLPRFQDRSIASCVSKRWLMLLSSIQTSEVVDEQHKRSELLRSSMSPLPDLNQAIPFELEIDSNIESGGYLTRSLDVDEATDTRLAAIAISAAGHGGLGKLNIRGCNSTCKATDVGLSAIGRLCPSLHSLTMWKVPLVSDAGLAAVADGCPMLENLDLSQCPRLSDNGLIAIAQKCPNLKSIKLDSCSGIGNDGLQAIGRYCQKLVSASIKDCPLVGDKGISGLVAAASSSLMKIKLQNLNINDVSLGVIGHYGKALTDIHLIALENISERGFWVMGNALNMVSLTSITISCCPGITDLGLEAIAKCCPQLKHLYLQRSCNITDTGLKGFTRSTSILESLKLEDCSMITLHGILDGLLNCSARFRSLALIKCTGIRDITYYPNELPTCLSLRFLTIRDCPGFTSSSLAVVSKLCPNLQQIDLTGLVGVTDAGFLPLVKSSESRLVKVTLEGCVNISDASIAALVKAHGSSLKMLHVDGCNKVSDKSLLAIVANCSVLEDLDISRCNVSDIGVAALSSAEKLKLRVLSLAGCYGVTKRSLQFLGKMKNSLEGLNLQQCKLSNAHGIGLLEEKLWWCDILS
ncbi:EIN3-binding F-box protein 1 isoform X1 [Dendrobium catenatum]|uniref:EIN3-binding F-box protein 1 isoform X1 n=1 Tax=Dendrobium catenatum TaxID=906689 RepID=UPI0009F6964B|nr:EIN3-binding F-box protein 1 isoform X1 [Dendrobium catenatum]